MGDEAANQKRGTFSWVLLLPLFALALLLAQRGYYLTHFGLVYTDGDQAAFWDQARDIARGIVREPCLYGQSYNVPVESWVAAPMLWARMPAYAALPVAAVMLALLPFVWLAAVAWKRGLRFGAIVALLIPIALPMEYVVVSSLPRGFINGIAVAAPAIVGWMFYSSRKAFFLSAFFAVLGITVNPSCAIILLAAGTYALLKHYRLPGFYLWSFIGTAAAMPAPLLIQWFYRLHPECNAYQPKLTLHFDWELLRNSIFDQDSTRLAWNHPVLDAFFGHFVPITERGWIVFAVLGFLVILLLLVRNWPAGLAIFLASVFTIWSLGVERIHSSSENVFYSGSRMYLALPVLFTMAFIWFDAALTTRTHRIWAAAIRGVIITAMLVLAAWSFGIGKDLLKFPSPLAAEGILPPVETVEHLRNDARILQTACEKYHADLVLIAQSYLTCMDQGGPVITDGAVHTLSPFFERRTYLIQQERTKKHTGVLVYLPTSMQNFLAHQPRFHATMVMDSPSVLLIETASPGMTGMDIAKYLGIPYRAHF